MHGLPNLKILKDIYVKKLLLLGQSDLSLFASDQVGLSVYAV